MSAQGREGSWTAAPAAAALARSGHGVAVHRRATRLDQEPQACRVDDREGSFSPPVSQPSVSRRGAVATGSRADNLYERKPLLPCPFLLAGARPRLLFVLGDRGHPRTFGLLSDWRSPASGTARFVIPVGRREAGHG